MMKHKMACTGCPLFCINVEGPCESHCEKMAEWKEAVEQSGYSKGYNTCKREMLSKIEEAIKNV